MEQNNDPVNDPNRQVNTNSFLAKHPMIKLFIIIETVFAIIGFVTLMPGKKNNIKEIPGMDIILQREIKVLVISLVIVLIWTLFNYFYGKYGKTTMKDR